MEHVFHFLFLADHEFERDVSGSNAVRSLILRDFDGNLNMNHIFLGPEKFKRACTEKALSFLQVYLEKSIHAVLSTRCVVVVIVETNLPIINKMNE